MPEGKPRSRPRPAKTDPEQSAEFIRVARELGCEENFAEFERALPRVAKARPAVSGPATAEPEKPAPEASRGRATGRR